MNKELLDCIDKNKYLCTNKKVYKTDKNSLSYLINKKLVQSECIKLGIAIEKIFSDFITKQSNFKNIKEKNKKGSIETDHLFKNLTTKTIIYAEFKGNLNLDTEKSKITCEKCLNVECLLKNKFPDYKIIICLVGCRYYTKTIIPRHIAIKYNKLSLTNLYGINEYLNLFCIDNMFSNEIEYKNILEYIASKII
jgi:hypothetical protein